MDNIEQINYDLNNIHRCIEVLGDKICIDIANSYIEEYKEKYNMYENLYNYEFEEILLLNLLNILRDLFDGSCKRNRLD